MKQYIFLICTIIFLSCNKSKTMDTTLKAIPEATVNGKTIILTADKSTGDVCALGWQMSNGSPTGATVSFNPNSSIQGDKNPKRGNPGEPYYISGTLHMTAITATVDKAGTYIFSLQVLDKNQNFDWADINVEVK